LKEQPFWKNSRGFPVCCSFPPGWVAEILNCGGSLHPETVFGSLFFSSQSDLAGIFIMASDGG
jgi:hypothetical protein